MASFTLYLATRMDLAKSGTYTTCFFQYHRSEVVIVDQALLRKRLLQDTLCLKEFVMSLVMLQDPGQGLCACAAFYKWLQQEYCADAVLHFGMHGTVEWLPGAPLGERLICEHSDCGVPPFVRGTRAFFCNLKDSFDHLSLPIICNPEHTMDLALLCCSSRDDSRPAVGLETGCEIDSVTAPDACECALQAILDSHGAMCCWATCQMCMSTLPTTLQSPSLPSGEAMAR